jgi:NAD(P)H-hydrate epimerase
LPASAIVVDALLGTGVNRPLEGLTAALVGYLNGAGRPIIALDLPSGLRADEPSGGEVVRATHTLTLGEWKLALMMAENAPFFGETHLLPIGLSATYDASTELFVTELPEARSYYRPRSAFSHKGNFGHALLAAGGTGKMGACVLASKGCLRSGVGLLTDLVPPAGVDIIQVSVPEAMALTDLAAVDASVYKAFGIGPGLGMGALGVLEHLLSIAPYPVVIDADAINLLGANPALWEKVPPHSILTPHPKEFERLFGAVGDDFAQMRLAMEQAVSRGCIIVLKGHRTLVACPDGTGHFNTTGNAGMATGGSGDVLTGIITGLLTQGYAPREAAILGVYLHGLSGDLALREQSMESLLASGIAEGLGAAYKYLAGESL